MLTSFDVCTIYVLYMQVCIINRRVLSLLPRNLVVTFSCSRSIFLKITNPSSALWENKGVTSSKLLFFSVSFPSFSIIFLSLCLSTLLSYNRLLYGLHIVSSCITCIYSIDTILYPYTLPFIQSPLLFLKSLPKCNLSSSLRS